MHFSMHVVRHKEVLRACRPFPDPIPCGVDEPWTSCYCLIEGRRHPWSRSIRKQQMDIKLVCSIEAVARSRLVTVQIDALLRDVATLLSNTHISLVVVCEADGSMAGVITKTNVVRCIGHCAGSACTTTAASMMTRDVAFCHPADSLANMLAMMQARGFVHVPVIGQRGISSGVINARDALRELLTQEQYEESLLRDYVMGIGYQ